MSIDMISAVLLAFYLYLVIRPEYVKGQWAFRWGLAAVGLGIPLRVLFLFRGDWPGLAIFLLLILDLLAFVLAVRACLPTLKLSDLKLTKDETEK